MTKNNRFLISALVGLIIALTGCSDTVDISSTEHLADESTRIKLDKGELVGFHASNGAKTWLGIPFAQPPVGELRWRAPQQIAPWDETLVATKHAPRCVQYTNFLDELEGVEPDQLIGNEDCLYLDIYAPSKTPPAQGWPVMVWVHGGSNTWGGANQYDASLLAESQNVVVVVIQFRLGPLGWFFHPSLNQSEQTPQTANFALLDIISSLKWVQDCISSFEGNKKNITLFGESAGAFDIYALLSMDESKGLFHKAILQSGAAFSESLESSVKHEYSAEKVVSELLETNNPSAAQIRNIPVDELYQHYKKNGKVELPRLLADGVTIPKEGVRAYLQKHWHEIGKPLIIGSNKDEAKFYFATNPELVNRFLGVYPYLSDERLYTSVANYTNKMWRTLAVNKQAQELLTEQYSPVFTYRFDWDDEPSFYGIDIKTLIGTSHTVEIPFVFGTFNNFMGKLGEILFGEDNKAERELLSAQMMSYWTQFAYTSAPNRGRADELPQWTAVTLKNNKAMVLDAKSDKGLAMYAANLSVEDILTQIRQDPSIENEAKRCFVATQIANFLGEIDYRIAEFKTQMCAGLDAS